VKDFGDVLNDIEPSFSLQIRSEMNSDVEQLNDLGFLIFGTIEKQVLKTNDTKTTWRVLHLQIVSKTSTGIIDLAKKHPNSNF